MYPYSIRPYYLQASGRVAGAPRGLRKEGGAGRCWVTEANSRGGTDQGSVPMLSCATQFGGARYPRRQAAMHEGTGEKTTAFD